MVSAGNLGIGTEIVTRAGPNLVVQAVEKVTKPQGVAVYNLEVEKDQTYFVGNANGGAWVHNSCRPGMRGNQATQALDKKIADDLEADGWEIIGGVGSKQEAIKDPDWVSLGKRGRPKGTVFPDITAIKGGVTLRIQTVDTLPDGQPTPRELNNIYRILKRKPGDRFLWFPKDIDW
jgi:hypothetical protein